MLIWQTNFPNTAQNIRHIATAESLTQILSGMGDFSVRVDELGETQSFPYFADFRLPETVFTRRVSLFLGDEIVVQAQSICETHTAWRDILPCGNTSLGTILFSGSLNIVRSEIMFATPQPYLLARRSWFEMNDERLYLVECFLPNLAHKISNET